MVTLYDATLSLITLQGIFPVDAFHASQTNFTYQNRILNEARSYKHIKDMTVSQKLNGKTYSINCVTITSKGLRYLISKSHNGDDQLQWLEYLSSHLVPHMSIIGAIQNSQHVLSRAQRVSFASLLAFYSGADLVLPPLMHYIYSDSFASDAIEEELNDKDMYDATSNSEFTSTSTQEPWNGNVVNNNDKTESVLNQSVDAESLSKNSVTEEIVYNDDVELILPVMQAILVQSTNKPFASIDQSTDQMPAAVGDASNSPANAQSAAHSAQNEAYNLSAAQGTQSVARDQSVAQSNVYVSNTTHAPTGLTLTDNEHTMSRKDASASFIMSPTVKAMSRSSSVPQIAIHISQPAPPPPSNPALQQPATMLDPSSVTVQRLSVLEAVVAALSEFSHDNPGMPLIHLFNQKCVADPSDPQYLRFNTGIYAKTILSQKSKDTFDARKGTYVGILDSNIRTLMVYAAAPACERWNQWHVRTDIDALRAWTNNYALHKPSPSEKHDAIMIIRNKQHFTRIIDDKRNHRTKSFLGKGYDRMFLCPLDQNGVAQLRTIALHNEFQLQSYHTSAIISTDAYIKNIHAPLSSPLQFLRIADNVPTAELFSFDLCKLHAFIELCLNFPQKKYAVLCRDWQYAYLDTVLPSNADIDVIDFPYLDLDISMLP